MENVSHKNEKKNVLPEPVYLKDDNTFDRMTESSLNLISPAKKPYPFLADWNVAMNPSPKTNEKVGGL